MSEAAFREQAMADGFTDLQFKRCASDIDGPLHTHVFAVTLRQAPSGRGGSVTAMTPGRRAAPAAAGSSGRTLVDRP